MSSILLGEWLEVVLTEEALEPGDVARYAHICGTHPFNVPQIIHELSPSAWKAASAVYEEKCRKRRDKMEAVREAPQDG